MVLPGVGAFGRCMEALRASAGWTGRRRRRRRTAAPFLGICVGMQMLYEGSEESPGVPGLGVLRRAHPAAAGRGEAAADAVEPARCVPSRPRWPLLDGLGDEPWVYFVHSYAAPPSEAVVATCDYGGPVVAAVERGRCGPPSSTRRSRARSGLRCWPTSWPLRGRGRRLMDLYPAIDLRGGRCVRLVEGDFGRETVYGDDPVAVARGFRGGRRPLDPRGRPRRGPHR